MANNKKAMKGRKLSWYMKAPIRFLAKARDMYVSGMNRCSPRFNSIDAAFGVPAGAHSISLPRSFSAGAGSSSSAFDDYRELVRVNSAPYRQRGVGLNLSPQKQAPAPAPMPAKVPRSCSVGIGRIDEDKPYEFDEDDFKSKPSVQARSRSYILRKSSEVIS